MAVTFYYRRLRRPLRYGRGGRASRAPARSRGRLAAWVSGVASSAYTLTAASGSYSHSGSAVGFVWGRLVSAGSGVYRFFHWVTNPSAYYPFDGDFVDHSGNGHDLTPDGNYFTFPAGKLGTATGSPGFDGNLGGTGVLSAAVAGKWSVSFWYLLPTDEEGITVTLAGSSGPGVQVLCYSDVSGGSDPGGAQVSVAGSVVIGPVLPAAPLAVWHNVVVVGDSGTLRLYLDGRASGTANISGDADTFSGVLTVSIGFDGSALVDDLAIVPGAMTAADVSAVWFGGVGVNFAGLGYVLFPRTRRLAASVATYVYAGPAVTLLASGAVLPQGPAFTVCGDLSSFTVRGDLAPLTA